MNETTPAAKPRLHYAWVILAASCLMSSAILGVVQNGRGVFYNAVCTDLGLETSAFTLYSLFHGIGSFLCMPFSVRFFNKVHPRIALAAAVSVFCGATALMGSVSTLPAFWTLGFLQGAGGSLLVFFICPLLISNWFKKHYGMAMGLSAAFSGLAGVFINPLLSAVIESAGWRTGYRVQGLLAFSLAMTAVALIRGRRPEDVGMTRLGAEDDEPEGGKAAEEPEEGQIGAEQAEAADGGAENALPAGADKAAPLSSRDRRVLIWVMLYTVLVSVTNAYNQHFAKYAVTIGLTPAIGAMLVSCGMVGNIGSKFGIGALNDRIGTPKTLLLSLLAMGLGFGGMIVGAANFLLYPSAVLAGLCMPLCSMCVPMLARHLYAPEVYGRVYPKITMVLTMASSGAITVVSLLYEIWYSYTPVLLIGVAISAACAFCIVAADRQK